MKKNNFYVTDDHNRGFVFVGNEAQIMGLRKLFKSDDFASNAIKILDHFGIFAIPSMKGCFIKCNDEDGERYSPYETYIWINKYLPGFCLEFVDTDGVPYFSTCDGLELWDKEHYEWYSEVLRLNELINELNIKMMSMCKKDIKKCEESMMSAYKKLEDMDYGNIDVVVAFSTPIRRLF